MAEKPKSSDPAAAAITRADALITHLETSSEANPSLLASIGKKVPAVRDWRVPVLIALLLVAGQGFVALEADNATVATIFALGAVTVAVLTGIVAALSYAQQSAIPLADLLAILKELLAALKEIKGKKDVTPPAGETSGGSTGASD